MLIYKPCELHQFLTVKEKIKHEAPGYHINITLHVPMTRQMMKLNPACIHVSLLSK
jgi:glycine cleavage system regulatory protein